MADNWKDNAAVGYVAKKQEDKKMTAEINKIVLTVGSKEFFLSVEEAKELMRLLMDTFGEKAPVRIPDPYIPIPVTPTYPWEPWYPYAPWKITWTTYGNTTVDTPKNT